MAAGEHVGNECSLIAGNIKSMLPLNLGFHLLSVNLHGNMISKIEGLLHLYKLKHLDLSSNLLSKIEGLGSLTNLQSLNLSCNRITEIEGMQNLINLKKVDLSYNRINNLRGLIPLHGRHHVLCHINLQGNAICSMEDVVNGMNGLQSLTYLTLQEEGKGNPVCHTAEYRELILQHLPQLKALDGISRSGQSVIGLEIGLSEEPYLEFLEDLVSCDSDPSDKDLKDTVLHDSKSVPVATPQIDKVLSRYWNQPTTSGSGYISSCTDFNSSSEQEKNKDAENPLREIKLKNLEDHISELVKKASKTDQDEKLLKPKRDTDLTTESDCESGKENRMTSVPKRRSTASSQKSSHVPISHGVQKSKSLSSVPKQSMARKSKSPSPRRMDETPVDHSDHTKTTLSGTSRSPVRTIPALVSSSPPVEESTYRALVQERDQERERRWKAEQHVEKLSDTIKEIQGSKELLEKEKHAKTSLQTLIHQLREENESLANETKKYANKEQDYQRTFQNLQEAMTKLETQRMQQEALEKKHVLEAERKAFALQRENELLRASERNHREKVQQLQDLLTSKEQAHRNEIDARVTLNGPEFQAAVAKEVEKEVSRATWYHNQQIKEFQEKMNALSQQKADLENEFRAALTLEANRFKEVKEGFNVVTDQLIAHKQAVAHYRNKEKQTKDSIDDLNAMLKKQKANIQNINDSREAAVRSLKSRIHEMEMVVDQEKRKTVHYELLQQERSKLLAQLVAHESLINALRAEKHLWGQELSNQGSALAKDRGLFEAKIEALSTELEKLKKKNERDKDALKIKSKMVDDQTETIRKLKEALQERDERIRKVHAENLEIEKTLRAKNDEGAAQLQELEKQIARKKELKLQLEEKEAELLDVKEAYRHLNSTMNEKWQNKEELLSQLETQVQQMKVNFDAKEKKLIEERDQSLKKHKSVMEKLQSLDDSFRRQLEAVLAAHKEELVKMESEKQKEIAAANEKVYHVEEEMRQLLQETANSKKSLEEKIRRLTSAVHDVQEDL